MISFVKKRKLSILLFFFLLLTVIFVLFFNLKNKININNNQTSINNNSMFAIMLEQEDGTYQESMNGLWPGDGYVFNETLSFCENGSKLTWNEELGAVTLSTGISDKCTLYFDEYIYPIVLEVTAIEVTSNSITVSVNAIGGTNNISTYYYSIDNGNNWISSVNNTYTFNNLNSGTEYNIQVYVEDSNNIFSNLKDTNVLTSTGLITFILNGLQYNAISGMTWYEWINSEYNYGGTNPAESYGMVCDDASREVYYSYNDGIPVDYFILYNNMKIYGSDVIVSNATYVVSDEMASWSCSVIVPAN